MSLDPIAPRTHASAEFESTMLGCLESVMRYARALTRDESDADDLVQETYLRAFRAWQTFDMTSDPRRWLFAIGRHTFLRQRQRDLRVVSVDEEPELDALAAVTLHKSARDEGFDRVFDRVDLRPAVCRALLELSNEHRLVVVLVRAGVCRGCGGTRATYRDGAFTTVSRASAAAIGAHRVRTGRRLRGSGCSVSGASLR